MPATSRHRESGSIRSASGLAGSPSKSTIFQPAHGAQRLAEVQVAVDPLGVQSPERSEPGERRPQHLRVRRELRHHRQRQVEPGAHLVGEVAGGQRRRGPAARRASGAPRRPPRPAGPTRRRSRRRPRRRAGRPRRRGCGRWPEPGPSRRWRCAGTAAASRGAACRRAAVDLDPAVERGDVLAAGPGQRLVDLDVGVLARGHLAEDLHQRVLAEGDRGVRLLAGEQRRVGVGVELVAGQPVEAYAGRGRPARVPCGGEGPETEPHRRAVVDGVVGVHELAVAAVPPADERVRRGAAARRRTARAAAGSGRPRPRRRRSAPAAARRPPPARRRRPSPTPAGPGRRRVNGRPLPPNQRACWR